MWLNVTEVKSISKPCNVILSFFSFSFFCNVVVNLVMNCTVCEVVNKVHFKKKRQTKAG